MGNYAWSDTLSHNALAFCTQALAEMQTRRGRVVKAVELSSLKGRCRVNGVFGGF
jgi:hypothetical protein